jgi:ribosome-binding protein aMBF1 (putative translation factor)
MRLAACLLVVALSTIGFADDKQKAEKHIRKITAMATDKTGRRIVSVSMADSFKVSRPSMVEQRRLLGLDYGSFFLAHELQGKGLTQSDLAAQLKSGTSVWQIGEQRHADWGQIAADAKKLNAQIDDGIYRHFLNKKNSEADRQRDLDDKYDPVRDAVRTDFDVTPKEIVDAQARYIFWRDQAGLVPGGGRMSTRDELTAEFDRAKATHTTGGMSPPAMGGVPSQ